MARPLLFVLRPIPPLVQHTVRLRAAPDSAYASILVLNVRLESGILHVEPSTLYSDAELYDRGIRTLIASWEVFAAGSVEAEVCHLPGVTAAIFPNEPERSVFNNAVLDRDAATIDAIDAMEAAYAKAEITHYAAWVHERDRETRNALEHRGFTLAASTRAMGRSILDMQLPRPEIELGSLDWDVYARRFGLPDGLLSQADHSQLHLAFACLDGDIAATALAFDCDSDCGIYNVTTLEHARRRGLGGALTALLLHDAIARGCTTASLQSTPMAERVYAAAGFRDLGAIFEYVPANAAPDTESLEVRPAH